MPGCRQEFEMLKAAIEEKFPREPDPLQDLIDTLNENAEEPSTEPVADSVNGTTDGATDGGTSNAANNNAIMNDAVAVDGAATATDAVAVGEDTARPPSNKSRRL